MDAAVTLVRAWCAGRPVPGFTIERFDLPDRTPVLLGELPASTPELADAPAVLLYGHLDKQPEMTGWREGLGPWTPVLEDGRLYGRGGADDGYAVFAAIAAIKALDAEGVSRPRCIGLIETCEESGSYDLPAYLDALAPRMGDVGLVIALDSGAGNYDQLWVTTSLRGLVNGTLRVDVLTEGVHSGDAGGVVPSSFRVVQELLDRIGKSKAFACEVPPERMTQATQAAGILGDTLWKRFPLVGLPVTKDPLELIPNRTWRPALEVTGAEGLPHPASAGNVHRPFTTLKLSLRLPPLVDGGKAAGALKGLLESDPRGAARVVFEGSGSTGWNAPTTAPWLASALDAASSELWGKPAAYMGEGGTIPFMSMLNVKFPRAQLVVTGVLGPKSNAHGPNEFIDVAYAKRVTAAAARVIASLP
jgi:acetylornithine deacetylase/succinyl-diaminopimelate desuccinylase-like protein